MVKSKIILIQLAVAIFSASIFCCCIGDVARAHQQAEADSHLPSCHRKAAEPASAPAAHDCDCHELVSLALQKTTFDVKLSALEFLNIEKFISIVSLDSQTVDSLVSLNLAQAPPGRLIFSVPLYLQHSNLRL